MDKGPGKDAAGEVMEVAPNLSGLRLGAVKTPQEIHAPLGLLRRAGDGWVKEAGAQQSRAGGGAERGAGAAGRVSCTGRRVWPLSPQAVGSTLPYHINTFVLKLRTRASLSPFWAGPWMRFFPAHCLLLLQRLCLDASGVGRGTPVPREKPVSGLEMRGANSSHR